MNTSDWATAEQLGWAADNGDAGFNALTDKVNVPPPDTVDMGSLGTYDYIFFGVNGGENETVIGKTAAKGVIVTGNGMDTITGGGLDDVVFSGNGKDIVHGGAGNDILFGENGADQLFGDSDNGIATVTQGEGETHWVINDDADLWDHDPNGETESVAIPSKATISKEGFFIAVNSDGEPTELDGGVPVVHVVFSVTPDTTGWYTIAYTKGSGLDGAGDPDFPGPSDQTQMILTAGQKYYFSATYDAGHSTVRVDAFDGQITVTGGPSDPTSAATSQAIPNGNWQDYFHQETTGGDPELSAFSAGDQLIGGHGPDTFTYDVTEGPKNVDIIWDFNQSSDVYDVTEGDKLVLKGVANLDQATIFTNVDLDGDGSNGLVIYFSPDHAIGLVGITDISQVDIQYA